MQNFSFETVRYENELDHSLCTICRDRSWLRMLGFMKSIDLTEGVFSAWRYRMWGKRQKGGGCKVMKHVKGLVQRIRPTLMKRGCTGIWKRFLKNMHSLYTTGLWTNRYKEHVGGIKACSGSLNGKQVLSFGLRIVRKYCKEGAWSSVCPLLCGAQKGGQCFKATEP